MQNLYIRFHDKFKFINFIIIQNDLQFAFFIDQMRSRQMRITSYFKSAVDHNNSFESKIKLISIKKHADRNNSFQ